MLRTSVHCLIYFPTCHGLKTWLELSRVKLCRSDLKENTNYLELAGGRAFIKFQGSKEWGGGGRRLKERGVYSNNRNMVT